MIWRIDVSRRPGFRDPEAEALDAALREARHANARARRSSVYLVESPWSEADALRVAGELLCDPVTEEARVSTAEAPPPGPALLLFRKPGVMDPVEASALKAFADLGVPAVRVRCGRRWAADGIAVEDLRTVLLHAVANEVVDEVSEDQAIRSIALGRPRPFRKITVPVRGESAADLERISREGGLAMTRGEMEAVRAHFEALGRDPTDVELETLAQTWSEHCKHKTFTGEIRFPDRVVRNLLKSTIAQATETIAAPWCLSVFKDNAGVIEFDDRFAVCFKVETHNHPSAIDPYGGAGTGIGGVIRDVLGCGLGARPIFSTDVFCVGLPGEREEDLPEGVLHPKRLLRGVVAGVRDYGNRMGIPTIAGAVYFDPRYTANPLVYCGTAGLLPRDKVRKSANAGDRIVVVGGRTGRDGIHGATFSSLERTHESESVSAGAVQIGNAIVEKRVLDTVLQARDRDLFTCITDCGAGGLSSAIGEMGAELGADVRLERVPLKYEGLSYAEIWISEAQERMVLAVPPAHEKEILDLFASEDVEATVVGAFTSDRRLRLSFEEVSVADLDMGFLHDGMPTAVREARSRPAPKPKAIPPERDAYTEDLQTLLRDPNIASKEWIIRQYDHEVQGGSAVKALTGPRQDAPSDASVVCPRFDSMRGVAVGMGMAPRYGDLDPYAMAAAAVDEAVRNVVSVGARPDRIALLDNFSWGRPDDPEELGALVAAAEACRDVAVALRTPFISGKDSLNNEYRSGGTRIVVPRSLLISAIGIVEDVRRCVTSDAKEAGHGLYVVGLTDDELGGSAFAAARAPGVGRVPRVDPKRARDVFACVHRLIAGGLARACHDLSEGGLAVAAAEMGFGGDLGIDLDLSAVPRTSSAARNSVLLFSESPSRFLVEVAEGDAAAVEATLASVPHSRVGRVTTDRRLVIRGVESGTVVDAPLDALRAAWKEPLAW